MARDLKPSAGLRGGMSLESIVEQEPERKETPTVEAKPKTEKKTAPAKPKQESGSLLDGIGAKERPKRKSYGYYLDDEVAQAVKKFAKQKGTNDSQVVNSILRKVLLEQ